MHRTDPGRRRPSWKRKFAAALSGVRAGVQGESSFCVHIFAAACAVAALVAFGCTSAEWAAVLGVIGLVMTAELMNTALETLFRGFDQPTRDRVYVALDVAAGAVLMASAAAVAVGVAVFGKHLLLLFRPATG